MRDKPPHTIEVLVRLAFTPKALTAIAVLAVTVITLLFKIDVDWSRLIGLLTLFSAVLVVGITLNLSPVPTVAAALAGSPEMSRCIVGCDYGTARGFFLEGAKYV